MYIYIYIKRLQRLAQENRTRLSLTCYDHSRRQQDFTGGFKQAKLQSNDHLTKRKISILTQSRIKHLSILLLTLLATSNKNNAQVKP